MSIEDMARFALAILWGGALCGVALLALGLWLNAATTKSVWGDEMVVAVAFFATLLTAGVILWTLSAADLFHVWDWLSRRRTT